MVQRINTPLCRNILSQRSHYTEEERNLLRAVTCRDWDEMHLLLVQGIRLVAQIEPFAYDESPYLNLGMTALHFAVRDHAPI